MAVLPIIANVQALAMPRTPLIGRTADIAAVRALLVDDAAPLVTLTGPGGAGKSRLAMAVANELRQSFRHGVWTVSLASVLDPPLVVPAIAQVLGVAEGPGGHLAERLANALGERHCLLVLDNFEQVIDAAVDVAALLGACPRLQILVTSREALRIGVEQIYPVPPLSLPDGEDPPLAAMQDAGAVRLFVTRAAAHQPDFTLDETNAADVAAICRQVDGLPLAIELAASRIRLLSPQLLRARLTHRLDVLTAGPRDAPDRQRTIRAAIAWSHELLAPDDQVLFRRLSVFQGGFTLPAVEEVCAGRDHELGVLDGLTSLADKSLIQRAPDDTGRSWMLETIREYALTQLDASGEAAPLRDAHASWAMRQAGERHGELFLPEDRDWLKRLESERANLRAALEWLAETGDVDRLTRLCASLGPFWYMHGHLREGAEWLNRALHVGPDQPAPRRAKLRVGLSIIELAGGHIDRARDNAEQGLALANAHGDTLTAAQALIILGALATMEADVASGMRYLERARALAPSLGDPQTQTAIDSTARANLGVALRIQGRFAEAEAHHEAALAGKQSLGSIYGEIHSLADLAFLALDLGDLPRASALFRETLALAREHDGRWATVEALDGLACVAAGLEQAETAMRLFGAADGLRELVGIGEGGEANRASRAGARARARDRLGEPACQSSWQAGRRLTTDQAIALALDPSLVPSTSGRAGKALGLTRRELDVLRLVVHGQSDREIAAALSISPRTVMRHLSGIYAKLDVANRTAASAYAINHRLV